MKKLLCLGGNYFQMTAVKAAKKLGYYVIDADYLPDNPAHKFADEYYNVSTLDRKGILEVASKCKVDGILSYASDVSAPTAAWVAEKLQLPTNPYSAVHLLTRKDLFHPFIREHGFLVPEHSSIISLKQLRDFFEKNNRDIIVKPVSASGSKGVTHVVDEHMLESAFKEAQEYSRQEGIIAEKFIYRDGHQIAGDAFVVNGKIAFFGLANEHFNNKCNPLVPVGESFPVLLSDEKIQKAKDTIQRLFSILKIKNGAFNLDFMFDKDEEIYIIEIGPRNGGNLITDAIKVSTGVDLAEYTVKAAVGDDISDLKQCEWKKYVSSYIWHTDKDMEYKGLKISNELNHKIIQSDMFVEKGEKIKSFQNGGFGIGAALIQYSNMEEMIDMMDHMNEYYSVE